LPYCLGTPKNNHFLGQTIKIPDTFTYRGFLFKKRLFRQPLFVILEPTRNSPLFASSFSVESMSKRSALKIRIERRLLVHACTFIPPHLRSPNVVLDTCQCFI